jgi:hypothetical protein
MDEEDATVNLHDKVAFCEASILAATFQRATLDTSSYTTTPILTLKSVANLVPLGKGMLTENSSTCAVPLLRAAGDRTKLDKVVTPTCRANRPVCVVGVLDAEFDRVAELWLLSVVVVTPLEGGLSQDH